MEGTAGSKSPRWGQVGCTRFLQLKVGGSEQQPQSHLGAWQKCTISPILSRPLQSQMHINKNLGRK